MKTACFDCRNRDCNRYGMDGERRMVSEQPKCPGCGWPMRLMDWTIQHGTVQKLRYGAVIVFKDGITKEQAENLLRALVARELIDADHLGSRWVHGFNPDHGEPVFYIP